MDRAYEAGDGIRGRLPERRQGPLTRGAGGDLFQTMPGCMCPKVKDIGPFSASRQ